MTTKAKAKPKAKPKAKTKAKAKTEALSEAPDAPQDVLSRLHTALGDLDAAIYAARRALDEALGRAPQDEPRRPLPLHELNALRQRLDLAASPAGSARGRHSIMDIARPSDGEDEERQASRQQRVGVAPRGRLRVD